MTAKGIVMCLCFLVREGWLPISKGVRAVELLDSGACDSTVPELLALLKEAQEAAEKMFALHPFLENLGQPTKGPYAAEYQMFERSSSDGHSSKSKFPLCAKH